MHGNSCFTSLLLWFSAAVLAVVFREVQRWALTQVQSKASMALHQRSFQHMLALGVPFHVTSDAETLKQTAEAGAHAAQKASDMLLLRLLPVALETLGTIVLLATWHGSGVAAAFLAAGLAAFVHFTSRSSEAQRPFFRSLKGHRNKAGSFLLNCLQNVPLISAYGAEEDQVAAYGDALHATWQTLAQSKQTQANSNVAKEAIVRATQLVAMLAAAQLMHSGTLSAGAFLTIIGMVRGAFEPIAWLPDMLTQLVGQAAAMEALADLLQQPLPKAAVPTAESTPGAALGLALQGVQQSYDVSGSPKRLKGVTFTAEPGKITALVGSSGAGKSTIVHVLLRFWPILRGRMSLDGQCLGSLSEAQVRKLVAWVPQDACLLNTTLRQNIALGSPQATDSEVTAAVEAAGLGAWLAAQPNGLDTPVVGGGASISGGERQRLAIARALLRKPRLLILDEATSALDSETQQTVMASVREAVQRTGAVCLLIAHRLQMAQEADKVLVLDAGELVQAGAHEALLQEGGRYAALWAAHASPMLQQPAQ